jgi:hypothetical protein
MTPDKDDHRVDEDPRLIGIAKALSDGLPVDWEDTVEDAPEIRRIKRRLRFLQTVAEAHRRLLERESGEDATGPGD